MKQTAGATPQTDRKADRQLEPEWRVVGNGRNSSKHKAQENSTQNHPFIE
ncbi:MAG: hypothetical protein MR301_09225 [Prevotella sp.]|nr:hypothetical protein [Prevotella sp.]MDD7045478.1 hypothetical protein [Prevotella sp.]MDY5546103.1 hypothetical protein [Prevotella sp.]